TRPSRCTTLPCRPSARCRACSSSTRPTLPASGKSIRQPSRACCNPAGTCCRPARRPARASRKHSPHWAARCSTNEATMSDNAFETLLPALDLVPFERRKDGSFASLLPPPEWFRPHTEGGIFPFLGHILEEATEFWNLGATGVQEWGPCADVDV